MLRTIGAVIVGQIVGSIANMALVIANILIFPMPAGLDFSDQAGMAAWIGTLPPSAFVLPLLAHLAQAFFGGSVAAAISKDHRLIAAMVVGVLSLVGGLINLMSIPGPLWMWVEVPLYLILPYVAFRLVEGRGAGT